MQNYLYFGTRNKYLRFLVFSSRLWWWFKQQYRTKYMQFLTPVSTETQVCIEMEQQIRVSWLKRLRECPNVDVCVIT